MDNYQTIVCGVDFSTFGEAASARAAALTRQFDAKLTFLHVVEYFPEDRSNEVIAPECNDPAEWQACKAREGLGDLAQRLGCPEAGLEVSFTPHAAWHEIIRFAGAAGADLIIVGCHGLHGIVTLLGSTANGVISRAPCDVLTVRPHG